MDSKAWLGILFFAYLVVAMFWGLALAILSASGFYIYLTMRGKRELTGIKKVFW